MLSLGSETERGFFFLMVIMGHLNRTETNTNKSHSLQVGTDQVYMRIGINNLQQCIAGFQQLCLL